MKCFHVPLLFLTLSLGLFAQTTGRYPAASGVYSWYVGTIVLPNTATTVAVPVNANTGATPTAVFIDQINLVNVTGSAVTVTVVDASTNCGGGACTIAVVSVPATSSSFLALHGSPANSGIKWSASTSAAIHASMIGRY